MIDHFVENTSIMSVRLLARFCVRKFILNMFFGKLKVLWWSPTYQFFPKTYQNTFTASKIAGWCDTQTLPYKTMTSFLTIYLFRKDGGRFHTIPALTISNAFNKIYLGKTLSSLSPNLQIRFLINQTKRRKFSKDLEETLTLIKSLLSGLISVFHYSLLFWTDVLNYSWHRTLEDCWQFIWSCYFRLKNIHTWN